MTKRLSLHHQLTGTANATNQIKMNISILVKSETEKALFGLIMNEMVTKRSVWFPKSWLSNISEKRYVDVNTGASVEFSERYIIDAEISEKNYNSKLEESN